MATQIRAARRYGSAAACLLLATAGVSLAARQQRLGRQLRELEERAIRNRALHHQQRMHWELLMRAIDDPSLAEVIDTYDKSIPAARRRQFFYANAWYINLFHLYRSELVDQDELYGHVREFLQSPIFREYWEASRPQRATLMQSSDEARLGHVVDDLIRDLDEADTDVWWVVGEPPSAE